MFDFLFKKKTVIPNLSSLSTDMHSHLLPGIDDGSPDLGTSIGLLKGMMELGYKKFIVTPHIMWDIYRNTPETIHAACHVLKEGISQAGLTVSIRPAAEYFVDDHFDELLESNTPLLTIKDNMVLIEVSFVNIPLGFKEKLFKLQIKGYQPVLAHPERYMYLRDNKEFYDDLKDAGCLFQLNLLSLIRYYGKAPADLADYLIKKNYIDFLGTDLHHLRHLEALHHIGPANDIIQRLLDSGKIRNSGL